jgi:hypothetical protein
LISQYELSSGWKEKHHILTDMEDSSADKLKSTVERALFAYKLRNIELLIEEKQNELKSVYELDKQDEKVQAIINEINNLNKAKSHFSNILTRIILH